MKKLLSLGICLAMFMQSNVFAQGPIRLVIDNNVVTTSQPPVIYNSRTLVPVRVLAENMDCAVAWNNEDKVVIISKDNKSIKLKIGSNIVNVRDGNNVYDVAIDTPATILNNSTMIPLRAASDLLDIDVSWSGSDKTIYVNTDKSTSDVTDDKQPVENKELTTQSLRKLSADVEDDLSLTISFMPDTVNDYENLAEEVNVYVYNRVGQLIYTESGQGYTIRNNNDFIEYTIPLDDILNVTDDTTFTTYSGCKIKVEVVGDDTVYCQGETNIDYVFTNVSSYNAPGINMSVQCLDSSKDAKNQIKAHLMFKGDATRDNINNLSAKCYDIRGELISNIPLGISISKGEIEIDQYYTLPSATSHISIGIR